MDLKHWELFRSLDPVFVSSVKWAQLIRVESCPDNFYEPHGSRGGLLITNNNNVYIVVNSIEDLELIGGKVDNYVPHVPYKIEALCGLDIKGAEVSCNDSHPLVLTKDGRVLEMGTGKEYFGSSEDQRVVELASGGEHTLARTSSGDVYAWGSNEFGQLGTVEAATDGPTKISGLNDFNVKLRSVACAEYSSYAVDEHGRVWSWGDDFALGYSSEEEQRTPKLIPTLDNIKKVVAGFYHALVLSNSGKVYFWGSDGRAVDTVPEEVKISEEVEDIGTSRSCSLSVCKTKDTVYFWGFHYGKHVAEPRRTNFTTMAEVFASLDVPLMLNPLKFECPAQPFLDKMELAFDDSSSADLKIDNNGEVIHAHKNLLQLRSEYFRAMFAHEWKEKDVCNPGFSSDGFRSFIYYLYTNRIEPPVQSADYAIELIKMGDYYGEKDLIKRAEQQLVLFMNNENTLKIYDVAVQCGLEDLQKNVIEAVSLSGSSMLRSDEYKEMSQEGKRRLMQKLSEEYDFVAVKRRRVATTD